MENKQLLNYEVISTSSNKEWIVMIHGAGGSIKTWKYQVSAFQHDYNLLLIDLRDHGLSKFKDAIAPKSYSFELISADIKHVMNHVGIKSAHFVTLSLGSAMIQHFMMVNPSYVNKSVFAGGIFKANIKMLFGANFAKAFNYILPYKLMYRLFSFIAMPKRRNQKARQVFIKQAEKLTAKEYRKWIGLEKSFFRILEQSFYYPFIHDMLVVMGQEDYVFIKSAKLYVIQQQHAQYVELSKAGHICNIEKPKEFNGLVLDFLNKQKAQ